MLLDTRILPSYRVKTDDVDRHQHEGIDRQQQERRDRQHKPSSNRHPPMTCRVLLPSTDADHLNETRNQSQTSVCLKTAEKTSEKPADAPEQDQSIYPGQSLFR